VSRILDEANTPASESTTTKILIKDFLNQSHQQRGGEFPWPFMLWPQEMTFSTILDQHVYILHPEFHRPLYFLNKTTGEYLQEVPFRAIRRRGTGGRGSRKTSGMPGISTSGIPGRPSGNQLAPPPSPSSALARSTTPRRMTWW